MNSAPDISVASVIMSVLLLAVPLLIVMYAKIGVAKNLIVSALRMSIQLFLIGFFLEYLFRFNLWYVNLLWLIVMIAAAMLSVLKNAGLAISAFAWPVFGAFLIANISVVLYFNFFIASIPEILDAKFVIAIGGMILGNSLRANIVGLGDFYQELRRNEALYTYRLSLGDSKFDALFPFAQKSFKAAISPTIATMATMGIVSLPGMMTGQILGGSVPLTAIKYQIAIMIAILASTMLSILLSVFFTVGKSTDKWGMLKKNIFIA